jgi:hypothetical protein
MSQSLRFSLIALLIVLAPVVALAQNVHFTRGPTCTDNGTTVTCSGTVAGLGNGDVTVITNATGTATTICTNPGDNVAPGQTSTVTPTGSVTLPTAKNGSLRFSVTTQEPADPTAAEAGCPNNKWTAEITDVTFTSVTLTLIQNGVQVFEDTFAL